MKSFIVLVALMGLTSALPVTKKLRAMEFADESENEIDVGSVRRFGHSRRRNTDVILELEGDRDEFSSVELVKKNGPTEKKGMKHVKKVVVRGPKEQPKQPAEEPKKVEPKKSVPAQEPKKVTEQPNKVTTAQPKAAEPKKSGTPKPESKKGPKISEEVPKPVLKKAPKTDVKKPKVEKKKKEEPKRKPTKEKSWIQDVKDFAEPKVKSVEKWVNNAGKSISTFFTEKMPF